MENTENMEEPQISIKKDTNGNYYLDFKIPEKVQKEIEQKVLEVSGAVIVSV